MMKGRVYILNEILKKIVHRKDIDVLADQLKPKLEFVIYVPLSDIQRQLYLVRRFYFAFFPFFFIFRQPLFLSIYFISVFFFPSFVLLRQQYLLNNSNRSSYVDDEESNKSGFFADYNTFELICAHPCTLGLKENDDGDNELPKFPHRCATCPDHWWAEMYTDDQNGRFPQNAASTRHYK